MRSFPQLAACLLLFSISFLLNGCGGGDAPTANVPSESGSSGAVESGSSAAATAEPFDASKIEPIGELNEIGASSPNAITLDPSPQVRVETTAGSFTIKLNREKAPLTVDNFLRNYAEAGFYSGTIVHYVSDGFMVAAGGFLPDGQAKDTESAIRNEADNGLRNLKGSVAMARDPDSIDSATCQFFINLVDNQGLDHVPGKEDAFGYCVFGEVTDGFDVIEKIAHTETHDTELLTSTPVESIVIKSIELID
ncbi:MAG: peptidylprolyl isomerase [Pirellulaceae bacterium]|jgi:cyclophilin family peptidyl-prolyl cis-trans isomerase|nr:peptidylprolyl isomerase [Pirellulaceae bacterium]